MVHRAANQIAQPFVERDLRFEPKQVTGLFRIRQPSRHGIHLSRSRKLGFQVRLENRAEVRGKIELEGVHAGTDV